MTNKILVVDDGPAFSNEMIEYMKQDLISDMGLTKMIKYARERLETAGKNFEEEFEKWKEARMDEDRTVHDMALFIDLARPGSGCDLAEDMDIVTFKGLFEMTSGNVCNGCFFTDNKCEFHEKRVTLKKAARAARFGKHDHKTNAEVAAERGITKRQVVKMRKRGEL